MKYAPVLTPGANCDSVIAAEPFTFSITDGVVRFEGFLSINPAVGIDPVSGQPTVTQCNISLPVAPAQSFTQDGQVRGHLTGTKVSGIVSCGYTTSPQTALVTFFAQSALTGQFAVSGSYAL